MRLNLVWGCVVGFFLLHPLSGQTQHASPDETRLLQGLLGILGYYQGPIDGVFGSETFQAVTRYSHAKGLASRWLFDKDAQQQLSRSLVADFVAYLTLLDTAGSMAQQHRPSPALPPTMRELY
jgi:peptidoglycan hydrolase-like protein with peptidoglycan-binding domain